MAAELIETSRVFAHTGAMVKPRWIELAAPHLVRRSHADARFSPRSGSVLCEERVLLYGLVLAAGRTVPLAPVDPVEARRLFIHEGLVREQARSDAPVLADNASARRSIEALEARIRRRDVLVGDQAIYRLYDRVLPPEALDVPTFEAWLREAPPRAAELRFRPEDLKVRETPEIDAASYPDSLMLGANRLAVDYRFSPGAEDDGATLTVPLPLLRGVDAAWLGWLIPGWLAEKIEVLLRLLPKPLRRQVVPVPDTARALAELARPVADELRAKLALERWLMTTLAAERGIDVPADAWRDAELPAHLAFRVRVVGLDGEVLAAGRDIEALRRPCLGEEETSEPVLGETPLERSGLRDWLFGDLPERVTVERGALTLELYPALIDRGTAVDLRLMDDPHRAARATADGVLRLALLVLGQQRRLVEQQVARDRALVLRAGALGAPRTIAGDVAAAAFADVLAPADIRTQAAFEAALEAGRGEVVPVADRLQVLARNVLERLASVRRHLDGAGRRVSGEARADIERQLEGLVYPGFLRATPAEWRSELPRYLQAIEVRIEKLEHGHPSDRAYMEAVQAHEARLDDWRARHPEAPWPAELVRYRWMIEELRVSLFAQALGTRVRVSARRLDRQWSEIEPAVAAPRPAD
jgi:ATP-dependent helicase HrpA